MRILRLVDLMEVCSLRVWSGHRDGRIQKISLYKKKLKKGGLTVDVLEKDVNHRGYAGKTGACSGALNT